jgi:hypothetical protein
VRTKHLPSDELAGDDLGDSTGRRVSGMEAAEFPERTLGGLGPFARERRLLRMAETR